MGKWYSHRTWNLYKEDIKVKRGHELDMYLPHVITIANSFPRDSVAIGALTLNDLIQAGNKGLVEAWAKADKSRPQPELWSFLKKRIKFAIRREIDNHGTMIKVPRRELERHRSNLTAHEKIYVNTFPKFFNELNLAYVVDEGPWLSVQLEEIICKELVRVENNDDHIDILLRFYGIGFERMSTRELSEKYNKKENAIKQIIHIVKKKLKNDEFEKIIENFYENL